MEYAHLFGPVNSRRLGMSLGVDLTPFKTCTLDCVYCECGATSDLVVDRKPYVPAAQIIAELDHCLAASPHLDYVTFAGSGEPTLNSDLGAILSHVKGRYPACRTALLTNGTLLHLADVREQCQGFDLVAPNLDAVSDDFFRRLNCCHPSLDSRTIVEGLVAFAAEYQGLLWLELFVVPGVNDSPSELALLRETINRIKPTRVQLNSLDRPGTCDWVQPAPPELLQQIAGFLLPLPVEILSRHTVASAAPLPADTDRRIVLMCRRRPCTVEDVAVSIKRTVNDAAAILSRLQAQGTLTTATTAGRTFYRPA